MAESLKALMEAAKKVKMTPSEQEEQRQSFAYGNTKIENDLIEKDTVARQSSALKGKAPR
ncbi:MAG: hypothetical protein O7D27_01315 [Alphaproteobacteria bacterium]|nr:hypothetical protein [Alphaproteobacteria bacterium]MCZ6740776.1 hypothetical protein [Alphaproteobacteria bacterium]